MGAEPAGNREIPHAEAAKRWYIVRKDVKRSRHARSKRSRLTLTTAVLRDAKDHKFSCPYITIIKGVTSGQPPVQAETREGEPAWSIVGDLAQAQPMSADAGGALDDLS